MFNLSGVVFRVSHSDKGIRSGDRDILVWKLGITLG